MLIYSLWGKFSLSASLSHTLQASLSAGFGYKPSLQLIVVELPMSERVTRLDEIVRTKADVLSQVHIISKSRWLTQNIYVAFSYLFLFISLCCCCFFCQTKWKKRRNNLILVKRHCLCLVCHLMKFDLFLLNTNLVSVNSVLYSFLSFYREYKCYACFLFLQELNLYGWLCSVVMPDCSNYILIFRVHKFTI